MPQGRCRPISDDTMEKIWERYERAKTHGLEREWMQWFVGGILICKLQPVEAAEEACFEWDV